MEDYRSIVTAYLEKHGVEFEDPHPTAIRILLPGENMKLVPIIVIFPEEGLHEANFYCWELVNFSPNTEEGIRRCNVANRSHTGAQFYLDEDGDVVADWCVHLIPETCGEEILYAVRRMARAIDLAYPEFTKSVSLIG